MTPSSPVKTPCPDFQGSTLIIMLQPPFLSVPPISQACSHFRNCYYFLCLKFSAPKSAWMASCILGLSLNIRSLVKPSLATQSPFYFIQQILYLLTFSTFCVLSSVLDAEDAGRAEQRKIPAFLVLMTHLGMSKQCNQVVGKGE